MSKHVAYCETAACVIASPLGPIRLAEDAEGIVSLGFVKDTVPMADIPGTYLPEAARQLAEYFDGRRRAFTVPLHPLGTPFQMKAWAALLEIPYGETATYGQQASAMGAPKAVRAVGAANGRNPIAIMIPCHRVVGTGGAMVGYAYGLEYKRALLDLEAGHKEI